jgi:hypothetical protein
VLRILGPVYAKAALGLDRLQLRGARQLVDAWREFQEGRARLILAFRHPYGDEAQLFSYLFDVVLPREARRLGPALPRRTHARFVHGYEVPLWSGPLVRWLLPRVGAVPVYHARFDSPSIARIRTIASRDSFPLALAPEGQVSYRSQTLPRIESGTARIAFWCAEDLEHAGRTMPVLVLPLSVHYRHDESRIGRIEALVKGLERRCGIAPQTTRPPADSASRRASLKARLVALDLALIRLAESIYGLPAAAGTRAATGTAAASGTTADAPAARPASRDARLAAVIEAALARAESMLGIGGSGPGADLGTDTARPGTIERVYRIRQAGWDRIYPERGLDAMRPLERGLADRRAGEAWYAMRHMETVDLAWYLDSAYLEGRSGDDSPTFDRLVECAYSLGDLASRLVGGDISHRPEPLRKRAIVIAAPPIDVGARLPDYRRDRKAAVGAVTEEIARAFRDCTREYLRDGGRQGRAGA